MGTVDVPTTSLHPVTPAEAKADAATVSSEKWVAHQLNVLKTPLTQLRLLSEHTVLQSLLFWSAAYSPEDEDCDGGDGEGGGGEGGGDEDAARSPPHQQTARIMPFL